MKEIEIKNIEAFLRRKHKCPLCNQYFQRNEKVYLIVGNNNQKVYSGNYFVHCNEYDSLSNEIKEDTDKFIPYIKTLKLPKTQPIIITNEQQLKIDRLTNILKEYGYYFDGTRTGVTKYKKPKTSLIFSYCVFDNSMNIDYRGRQSIFDRFAINNFLEVIERQLERIENE